MINISFRSDYIFFLAMIVMWLVFVGMIITTQNNKEYDTEYKQERLRDDILIAVMSIVVIVLAIIYMIYNSGI